MCLGRCGSKNRLDMAGAFLQWLDNNHVDHSAVQLAKISEGAGLGLCAAHTIQVFLIF